MQRAFRFAEYRTRFRARAIVTPPERLRPQVMPRECDRVNDPSRAPRAPKFLAVKKSAGFPGEGKSKMAEHKTAHTTPSLNNALYEEFLTEKQLAARHRRGPKTLRNDRVKGSYIPFHKLGNVRYRLSDVIAYEQAHRVACVDPKIGVCAVSFVDPREETFLTPPELAKRHQRSEKTLRNDHVQRRYISFYKIGAHVRYALSDVLAYEQAHRATSTTSAQARDPQQHAPARSNTPQQDRPNTL
jgi:hypothetical protein